MYSVSTEIGNNLRKNTGFASIDVAFTPGYAFDGRFFVGVPLTLSNELFRTDGVQTYESNFRMGISAGYNILSHDNGIVSLSAAFGGSVYTQYHRSLYYDLCAKWGTSAYFKPLVGLGVRYYQSLGNTGKDRLCLYVSIGFRFNCPLREHLPQGAVSLRHPVCRKGAGTARNPCRPKAAQGGPTSAIIPIFDCGVPKKHVVSIRLRRQQIFSAPGRLFPTTYFSYFCRSRCGSRVIHTADSRNSFRKRLTSIRTNGRYAHMARPPRSRSWFCFDER